ncbi:MAG: FecR domain-containing protein, partial [Planctomycetota bacterium]
MRRNELIEFYQLVVVSLEGEATEAQAAALMQKVKEDDQAARFYAELLSIYANLACPSLAEPVLERLRPGPAGPGPAHESTEDTGIWNALLDMERMAPGVETEKPAATPSPDTKTPVQAPSGKKQRFWMYTSLVASAALIVLLLYVRVSTWLLPREVATLTSGIKAQWDVAGEAIDLGQRLLTKTPLRLNKGFAELVFDEGAKVVVEAPAVFELRGEDRMMVHSGRITTLVSEAAQGFRVDTPTSRVTDLGTEFGVQVSHHGDTVVQMYQGRAQLALKSVRKKNVLIQKGQAREVNAGGTTITEIPFEPRAFVTVSNFVSMRDRPLVSAPQKDAMARHPALCVHLDASRISTLTIGGGDIVSAWRDNSTGSSPYDASLQKGTARCVADALGPGLGAVDFGNPDLALDRAGTQMSLMTQLESKIFLDQTPEHASGFTVALVVRAQSRGAQNWCNIIGNTSVIHVSGFFVRWTVLDDQPMAAAFLGGQELLQECAVLGNTVVLVCCYDRKRETLSLWNSSSNQTSRKTVKPGDYTTWIDAKPASDPDRNLYLGAFGRNKERYFDGMIGEVRIYRQALDLIE